MILNKFSSISIFRLRKVGLQFLALSLFSCNKTANINANKSFVSVTHVAYGVGPLTVTANGTPFYSGTLSFSNTTGNRTEKELIVLVTPYLVEPMNADQKPDTSKPFSSDAKRS